MKNTRENGITLIALIITIIVMLILVGVTVSVALNGGLFSTAKEAANRTDKARIEEEMQGAILAALDNNGNIKLDKLKEEISKIKGIESVGENFPLVVKDKNGNEWEINTNGEIKFVEPEVEKVIAKDDPEASYWKTNGEGTIIYYDLPDDIEVPETLIVPCKIGDEKITKIGDFALCGYEMQRNEDGSIFVDEKGNVVLIDTEGKTTKIKNIIVSKGIEEIGQLSMGYCTNAVNIKLPRKMKVIGDMAFIGCTSLETATVSSNKIGGAIFSECTSLKTATISGDEKGEGIFGGCTSLKTVTISGEMKSGMFGGCELLETVIFQSGVTEIPEGAFEIGSYAKTPENLKYVELPETLVTIGERVFSGCTSIKEITIPSGVDNIGYLAFGGWTKNQTIYIKGKTELPPTTDHYSGIGWEKDWYSGEVKIEFK